APRGNGRGKIADLFCSERFAARLPKRDQALQSARETRSRFAFLASARSYRRRNYRRRFLSEQLDRRDIDPAFRIARNSAPAARARRLGSGAAVLLSFRAESRNLLLFLCSE